MKKTLLAAALATAFAGLGAAGAAAQHGHGQSIAQGYGHAQSQGRFGHRQTQTVFEYVARLGADDHYNSRGVPLRSVAKIIEQDRANVHRFGKIDREDTTDGEFRSPEARALFQTSALAEATARLSRRDVRAILHGAPLVKVTLDTAAHHGRGRIDIDVLRY